MAPRGLPPEALGPPWREQFAADVRAGLDRSGQKELPSKYLYDDVGSALFEVITLLPEYGLTRADQRLLQRHAGDLVALLPNPVAVAELGSGSGKKTRLLLEALARRQQPVTYSPIDISPAALEACRQELASLECVRVRPFERTYLDGLREVATRRPAGEHLLLLFLGSTIGNFDRPVGEQFLADVRRALRPGDTVLLSTDLEKPVKQLLAAYDDSLGVTAAFNLNLLARLNRELGADFDLSRFRHEAHWNPAERRIEMHLRSTTEQTVTIRKAELTVKFARDETIWTESSHKYNCDEVRQIGQRAGFRCQAQWVDPQWPFAQTLFAAV
ncbi:MAG: L-histidine N(alpha)-methyltransferase [Candidatus Acidoferrales bacterium]